MYYVSTSGNTILKKSLWYLYEKCTYLIKKGEVNLEKEEILSLEHPLKEKYVSKVTRHKDYSVLVTLEWIGAPIEFLNAWKFKELPSDTYVAEIKENRKNSKKSKQK